MENRKRYGFVPVPTITSFDDYNDWLFDWCEKDATRDRYKYKFPIQELWEEDRAQLLKLPEYPFSVFRYEVLSINKSGFAVIDTNRYGLSPPFAAENGRTDADSIRQCYYMIARKEFRPDPLKLVSTAPVLDYQPNLSAYDGLMGGDANV